MEAINLILVPYTAPLGKKDPEQHPGYERRKDEPIKGGQIFSKLVEISIKLFDKVSKAGRNLSSMTTKVTIMGDEYVVNSRKAELNGIKIKEVNGKILCETTGIVDTGTDTNCIDRKLREVLGRDALRDAGQVLQGCTGSSDNMKKYNLRLVCMDKQITVVEARGIDELGYNGPNSKTFMEALRTEMEISVDKERHFDFNDEGVIPRLLVGLKSGDLLSNQLTEQEMLELVLKNPYFSPNLKI